MASAGTGSSNHLVGELCQAQTGVKLNHIPYKGSGQALNDLLAGQVSVMFDQLTSASANIKAGKLRALAVLGKDRLADFPDIQTAAESGMPGFEVDTWYGVLAPAGVPREIVVRLNAELTRMMQAGEMRERLAALGVQPLSSTPEKFGEFLKAEVLKWAAVVKASGARAD